MYYFYMKIIMIFIFLLGYLYCYNYNNYYEFVYSNLIEKESGWVHSVKGRVISSKKNAIGVGQVTKLALQEYNKNNKKKYTFKDLKIYKINLKISRWYFFQYIYTRFNGHIIKMVNSYNMGGDNTLKGKFNFEYIRDIVPIEFSYWVKGKTIIRFYSKIWVIDT